MRLRLLALAVVPLVGLSVFAALWADDRQARADAAREQQEVTRVVTGIADIRLALDIEERVAALDGSLSGPVAVIAQGALKQAREEIRQVSADLDRDAALIDRLARRPGAWRTASARVAAVLQVRRRAPESDPEAGKSLVERLGNRSTDADAFAGPLAAQTALDGRPRRRSPASAAAEAALVRLLDGLAGGSGPAAETAGLVRNAANVQVLVFREIFAVTARVVRDEWAGAGPVLLGLQSAQRAQLDALRWALPPRQAAILRRLLTSRDARAWAAFRRRLTARALGDRSVRLPTVMEMSPRALPWMTTLGEFPEQLGDDLRHAAAAQAAEARREARGALAVALAFFVGTLGFAALIGASIRRPLRRLEQRARLLGEGDLDGALAVRRRTGPPEIAVVSSALDELAANLEVVQRQASALAAGETHAPVLREAAPGPLGEALQRSVGTLSAVSEQLRESEALSRAMIATAADAIWTVGADGRVTDANPAAVRLLDGADVAGRPVTEVLGSDLAGDGEAPVAPLTNEEIWIRRPEGSRIPVLMSTSRAGTKPVWTVFARDISVLKNYEAELSRQAFHDALTDLPNRALLLDRLEHAIARTRRDQQERIALVMVDLDDFKSVNDALGHATGDELLVAVAERLRSCLRPGDTAARLGGDEFAILLEDITDPAEAETIAGRLVEALALPLHAGGQDLACAASVGIRLSDADSTPTTLLRDADTAMYSAKGAGKGRAHTFTPAMHDDAARRLLLRTDLHEALAGDQLHLLYQPVVDLTSQDIVAAEALLRWEHPLHGVVPPLEFIPTAEESGLILPIGRWVLREACTAAASWPDGPRGPLAVNVNVSGVQILQDDTVEAVRDALAVSGLEPGRLVLELTESVLLEDVDAVAGVLVDLKALGVRIAVDDFGTGYCSLAYLKRFPVDHLKIDRSFTEDLTAAGDRSLARSIVDLAGVLGLAAVAEGVETAEQADLLRGLACDLAQGYHFSRPVAGDALVGLLGEAPAAV